MPTRSRLRPVLILAALLHTAAVLPAQDPAPASPAVQEADPQLAPAPFAPVDLRQLEGLRGDLTRRLVAQLADPDLRSLAARRLGPGQVTTPLPALLDDWSRLGQDPRRLGFADQVRDLDRDLREQLGIAGTSASLLALDLVRPEGLDGPLDWDRALLAVRPSGGPPPAAIQAYDLQGRTVLLDPRVPPRVPVLMAGLDRREAVRAGVEAVNRGLAEAGLAAPVPVAPVACLKLEAVRVGPGFESWWSRGLEPYALASGIDPVEAKPAIRLVQLPYLQHGQRDYRPDQVVLFWSDYRFAAANLQFWNHEDATSFKELLDAIIKGATAALALAGMPQFALIPAIADAILQAMPSSWWAGSDVLMDTFYTLEKGVAYEDRTGAMGKVRVTLAPWVLQPQ
jgi:hypothetical protein